MPYKDPEKQRENYLKNAEKHRARMRANYLAKREERLAKMTLYQKEHPEVWKRATNKWLANNPEKRRLTQATYAQKNRKTIQQKRAAREKAHPEKLRLIYHRRKARKLGLPDTWVLEQQAFMLNYWKHSCAACGAQEGFWWKLSVDHWIPLNSPLCPGTIATNLVPLCCGTTGCNTTKRDTDPKIWLERRFGPRKAAAILRKIATYFTIVAQRFPQPSASAAD